MEQVDNSVLVSTIIPSNNNPRWEEEINMSEEGLYNKLLSEPTAVDLLTSMYKGLIWANKIVVAPIKDLSVEEQKALENISKGKEYVVVEGNTRLACLNHMAKNGKFDKDSLLGVVVAKRSTDESDDNYIQERRRLQNVIHLMRSTGWKEIPKARQFYYTFLGTKKSKPDESDAKIFKDMAKKIGSRYSTVKGYIYKYLFYLQYSNMGYRLDGDDFKYMETFEQSIEIRKLFGYSDTSLTFCWEDEQQTLDSEIEEVEERKELLELYLEVVHIAEKESITSKKLRDIISNYKNANAGELLSKFKDLIHYTDTEDYTKNAVTTYLDIQVNVEEKEVQQLTNSFNKAIKTLKTFPVNEDYAMQFKDSLINIRTLSDNLLKYLM